MIKSSKKLTKAKKTPRKKSPAKRTAAKRTAKKTPIMSSAQKRILVTGATGFVGTQLCNDLIIEGYMPVCAIRNASPDLTDFVNINIGDLNRDTDWSNAFAKKIDTVVHLAARVHVMEEKEENPLDLYREVNLEATKKLAEEAVKAKVRRFIYISTIKVNGEQTFGTPFSDKDKITPPYDYYGLTKHEAEEALKEICAQSKMELVIIRPPLVYGPKVKGNFISLIKLIDKGIPLPLGALKNKRSFIYVKNLTDAIIKCITTTEAAGKTFLVKDTQTLTTAELVELIKKSIKSPALILPIPISWLNMAAKLLKKQKHIEKLTSSLEVNDDTIRKTLGWKPPFSVKEGLKETALWYREYKRNNRSQN